MLTLPRYVHYTSVFNCLDYPACVFPVTTVDPDVDLKKPAHEFLNENDEKWYHLCTSASQADVHSISDAKGFILDEPEKWRGAPVALQLVGQSYDDEAVVGMTEVVDAALKTLKVDGESTIW